MARDGSEGAIAVVTGADQVGAPVVMGAVPFDRKAPGRLVAPAAVRWGPSPAQARTCPPRTTNPPVPPRGA